MENSQKEGEIGKVCYKCGKCRVRLFNEENLELEHQFAPKANYSYKRHKNNMVLSNECSSFFLKDEIGDNNERMKLDYGNKILCKRCNNKLGEFLSRGTQCSCGSWVVPAIQIVKSKVDKFIIKE